MKLIPLEKRLDRVLNTALAENRIVGTVVRVMHQGVQVYERSAGYADREAKRTMRRDNIFRLASVSKPIVSAAALALIDQGRLRLDDAVTRYLPYFHPKLADGTTPTITIHHLLTHTAGLNYGFLEPADGPYHRLGVSDGLDRMAVTLEENMRRLAAAPLLFVPGTRWNYSLAIDVLGAVLAQVAGKPLPELVAERITRPLQMRDTGFRVTDRARLDTPYTDGKPKPIRMRDNQTVPFGGGAGPRFAPGRALSPNAYPSGGAGMVGTASDITRFLEAVRKGTLPGVKHATIANARQDRIPAVKADTQGPGWGFGYGWAVLNDPSAAKTRQSAGTLTWGGAYGHYWFVDPEAAWTVVVMTNTAFEGMSGAFTREVRDAIYATDRG